jgi:ribosome-associated protein
VTDTPGRLRISRTCAIAIDELEWRFSASGGPGGQHANTANTKAEVRLDLASSPSLSEVQRARLVAALGPVVRVVASEQRSQAQNRALALERLRLKLAAALVVPKHRVDTRPTKGSQRRRVETKRRRGDVKRERRRPGTDD